MADTESRSIVKQIKRYAQVGGVVGKLATKLASQKYLGIKLDKEKHALEIREALGGIKVDGKVGPETMKAMQGYFSYLKVLKKLNGSIPEEFVKKAFSRRNNQ